MTHTPAPHVEQRLRDAFAEAATAVDTIPDVDDLAVRFAASEPAIGGHAHRVEPAARRRRTRRTVGVAALATALVVGGGTAVVAVGGYLGEDAPGARYVPLTDLPEVVRAGAADLPFAPHTSLEQLLTVWDEDGLLPEDAVMSTDGMVDMMAYNASCSWLDHWRTATLAGDTAASADAIAVIEESRRWPWWSIVNVDTAFTGQGELAGQMRAGDVEAITRHLGINCAPPMTDVPPPTS